MRTDWGAGDIISYCGEEFEILHNYGEYGAVKEHCIDGDIIEPYYWDIFGEKCKLVKKCIDIK